ncbi:MAG: hypothetical protein R3A79_20360 [Nannocystaceae bacterium]
MKRLLALSLALAALGGPSLASASTSRCAPANAEVVDQYRAAEDSLRELAWAEMADFFAAAQLGEEPRPQEDPATTTAGLALAEALLELPTPRRAAVEALARSATVDRLRDAGDRLRERAFRGLSPTALSALLDADDPTLRANTWWWLATSPRAACVAAKIERARFAIALGDRSRVVESGDDLVFRRVADYALAAYLRRLADAPTSTEALLRTIVDAPEGTPEPPRLRAVAAALLIRRGDAPVEAWLDAEDPAIRLAVALAALERDRPRWQTRLVEVAAADGDDLVSQGIVNAILDRGARSSAAQELRATSHPRLAEAVLRWQGEGDPRAPLPVAATTPINPARRGYAGLLAAR